MLSFSFQYICVLISSNKVEGWQSKSVLDRPANKMDVVTPVEQIALGYLQVHHILSDLIEK